MKADLRFDPFFIELGPAGTGARTLLNLKVELRGTLELQVVGGGPIFLFEGAKTAAECFALVNAEKEFRPHYLLAAVKGQAAWRNVKGTDVQITAYADVASIGHLRLSEECGCA